jgi:DNA polymerase V
VIVLSNNDGCAISRSEEAKALGIAMASPAFIMEVFKETPGRGFQFQLYAVRR